MNEALHSKGILEALQVLITTQNAAPLRDFLAQGNNLFIYSGVLFLGCFLLLLLVLRAVSVRVVRVPQQSEELMSKIQSIETLLTDLKAKHTENATKVQGEILYIKAEIEMMRPPVDRIIEIMAEADRKAEGARNSG